MLADSSGFRATKPSNMNLPAHRTREYFSNKARNYRRKSAGLPWVWVRQRERMKVAQLLEQGRVETPALDLGCGAGYYTSLLLELGATKVTAVDISIKMIDEISDARVAKWCGDAASRKLPGRYKCIVSAGLLEFVDDPASVLQNARRVAETDASFVLLLPARNLGGILYKSFHRTHGLDVQLFTVSEVENICREAGWRPVAAERVWPFALVFRLVAGPSA